MSAELVMVWLSLLAAVLIAAIFWGPAAAIYVLGIIVVAMAAGVYVFGDRLVRLADEMFEADQEESS